uniref:Peptidase M10 metallopeptidase domain-containing protein n=1 Tax=Leersia perrieri TaxID=77586 RepID=A0A0D9XMC6_9ORYZ
MFRPCLLLLAIVFILSCHPVAAARLGPTTTKPHGGGAVNRTAADGADVCPVTDGHVDYLPRDTVRAVLRSAFARWAEVIPVSFEEIMDDDGFDGADIKVGFYHGEHGDGPRLMVRETC